MLQVSSASSSGAVLQPAPKRSGATTIEEIKRIDLNRENRRKAAEDVRRTRQEEAAMLGGNCGGVVPDIDFHRMIRDFRQQCPAPMPLETVDPYEPGGISVCVRKRPLQQHEVANRELDCVSACNPLAIIHESKLRVDGITKCLESHQFEFDRVFDEEASTDDLYRSVAQPLVPWVIETGGRVTLFAYGQTGSGKTHTMTGIQRLLAQQLFEHLSPSGGGDQLELSLSFFEIYGGRPYDLLNNRQRLETLEDARNEVQIAGLTERLVGSPEAMLQCIELGNSMRTTHATAMNQDSSRSHAVCAMLLRAAGSTAIHAKVTLVDLAGSERAADSKSSIRQRRVEGAQINKSLLALKECIRAMGDPREAHVPFRASKLTLVLRDAFASKCPSRTVMIACISPGISSADHSVNTLRYSDRLKDNTRTRHKIEADESMLEGADRGQRRTAGAQVRDSRSPEGRQLAARRRSPSPAKGAFAPVGTGPSLGQRASGSSAVRVVEQNYDAPLDVASDSEDDDVLDDDLPPLQAKAAWEDSGRRGEEAAAAVASTVGRSRHVAALPQTGQRQSMPPRGRQQPTLSSKAGPLHGSRALYGDVLHAVSSQVNRPSLTGSSVVGGSSSSSSIAQPGGGLAAPVEGRGAPRGEGLDPSLKSPPAAREQSPHGKLGTRESRLGNDLVHQDDKYLHNTLTTEVFERGGGLGSSLGVVDVGVQDLADLAHMEALDEVRQWEDRIVQQHMVALQEDARLLTAESELLSQVQQGASYDIDWYVSEVDKVVRRKMHVYESFLEDLEVFKAQLRREEFLNRSWQRNRDGRARPGGAGTGAADGSRPGDGDAVRSLQLQRVQGDVAEPAAEPAQRTPRSPRS